MEIKITKEQILGIALQVRRYKKLYVTSEGTMFRNQQVCESAIRTKNMIITEPQNHLGYIILTESDVTLEKLRAFGKNKETFDKLFDKAVIPRQRQTESREGRKPEETVQDNADDIAQLSAALGLTEGEDVAEAEEPKAKKARSRNKKEEATAEEATAEEATAEEATAEEA